MTGHMFVNILVPQFVALDPVGVLPIYLSMTSGMTHLQRRVMGVQAVGTAFVIAVGFMFVGESLFNLLHVTVADFQVAGGLLLLVLAMIDLLLPGKPSVDQAPTAGIVPLAMPLIAGPATLTTALVLVRSYGYAWVGLGLALNFLVLAATLAASNWFARVIGVKVLSAVSKLVMLLLAAIAISYIRAGVTDFLQQLHFTR